MLIGELIVQAASVIRPSSQSHLKLMSSRHAEKDYLLTVNCIAF